MTDTMSLFDAPTDAELVLAPEVGKWHRDDPATSRRAGVNAGMRAGALKHRILRHLADVGDHGATDFELHRNCDANGRVHSAANRRKEMQDRFDPPLIVTTAHTRPTDTGEDGHVHRITTAGLEVLAAVDRIA